MKFVQCTYGKYAARMRFLGVYQPASAVLATDSTPPLSFALFGTFPCQTVTDSGGAPIYHDGRVTSSTGPASAHACVPRVVSDDSG